MASASAGTCSTPRPDRREQNRPLLGLKDGVIQVGDLTVPVPREWLAKATGEDKLTIGIRPENFDIADDGEGIGLDVAEVEDLGADAFPYDTLAGLNQDARMTAQQIVARISSRRPPARGSTVRLTGDPERFHVFSTKTLGPVRSG